MYGHVLSFLGEGFRAEAVGGKMDMIRVKDEYVLLACKTRSFCHEYLPQLIHQ